VAGISQKVLTDNLRSLEEDGIVVRKIYAEVPPRVEYSLSELGETLRPIIDVMEEWGTEYKARQSDRENKKNLSPRGFVKQGRKSFSLS
jgi:DNA-binding HxlR family transcriptional regulator